MTDEQQKDVYLAGLEDGLERGKNSSMALCAAVIDYILANAVDAESIENAINQLMLTAAQWKEYDKETYLAYKKEKDFKA